MIALVAFCFLVILGLLLCSISIGLRFYEKQRRQRLVSMLRTVTENGEERHVNLLVDEGGKKNGTEELAGPFSLARRTPPLLSESGLDWTLTRLMVTSGAPFSVGAIASLWIPIST